MARRTLLYFAYGSNMDVGQMTQRLSHEVIPMGIARLDGYRLDYWGRSMAWSLCGTADITPTANNVDYVMGVVYELSRADLTIIDSFEHVAQGRYMHQKVSLIFDGQEVQAITYVLRRDEAKGYTEELNLPSPDYRSKCATAARSMQIAQEYVDNYLLQLDHSQAIATAAEAV